MSNFSDYLELKIVGATLCKSSFTTPQSLWLAAICSMASTDVGTIGTGASQGCYEAGYSSLAYAQTANYTRQPVLFYTPSGSASVANTPAITWSAASLTWGAVSHMAVMDSGSYGLGNILYWVTLASTRQIDAGDTLQVPLGGLVIYVQ